MNIMWALCVCVCVQAKRLGASRQAGRQAVRIQSTVRCCWQAGRQAGVRTARSAANACDAEGSTIWLGSEGTVSREQAPHFSAFQQRVGLCIVDVCVARPGHTKTTQQRRGSNG